jgi:hypothetical protein
MAISRMRLTALACVALLACAWVSACGGDGGESETVVEDTTTAAVNAPPAPANTVRVRVGLTGLILLMPPSNAAGATQLFMPRAGGHVAYLAFEGPNTAACNRYNPDFGICFVSLDGVRLEPIGRAGHSAGRPGVPTGAVNVFHGSTTRADTTGINSRIRARASLLSGRATSPCHLAEWTFPPLGPSQELTSVLTWDVPDHQGNDLTLVLEPVNGTSPARRQFTLAPTGGGPIELLILHLPTREFELLRRATRGPGANAPPDFDRPIAETEASSHFEAVYTMINAPANPRPKPVLPIPNGNVCEIEVLGLGSAVYPTSRLSLRERQRLEIDPQLVPAINAGVRTYSCVMTSADG